eukprot:TRINITY_DN2881_c0_g1_i3.p1 TRINITY_DN2881_c0_g1~~TRINITY_DN2881_c0_g1_i3.p1  ORF type:complete len:294 (+),score=27.23 TRINITY_DN2881_c0_g1_i3:117-998(+)
MIRRPPRSTHCISSAAQMCIRDRCIWACVKFLIITHLKIIIIIMINDTTNEVFIFNDYLCNFIFLTQKKNKYLFLKIMSDHLFFFFYNTSKSFQYQMCKIFLDGHSSPFLESKSFLYSETNYPSKFGSGSYFLVLLKLKGAFFVLQGQQLYQFVVSANKGISLFNGDLNYPLLYLVLIFSISGSNSAGLPQKVDPYVVEPIKGRSLITVGCQGGFKAETGLFGQLMKEFLQLDTPAKGKNLSTVDQKFLCQVLQGSYYFVLYSVLQMVFRSMGYLLQYCVCLLYTSPSPRDQA